jgi:predicted transcriptional regulator
MASGSVSVRLPDEVLEQLDKLAQERKQKISDVVRELIVSGLASEKTGDRGLHDKLSKLERLAVKAAMAAGKAQFLASMSVGFCADVTKLLVSNTTPETEEKTAFLNQTNEWAENFARDYLKEESDEEAYEKPI